MIEEAKKVALTMPAEMLEFDEKLNCFSACMSKRFGFVNISRRYYSQYLSFSATFNFINNTLLFSTLILC